MCAAKQMSQRWSCGPVTDAGCLLCDGWGIMDLIVAMMFAPVHSLCWRRSLGTLCHCQALFDEVCYWAVCLSARWAHSNHPKSTKQNCGLHQLKVNLYPAPSDSDWTTAADQKARNYTAEGQWTHTQIQYRKIWITLTQCMKNIRVKINGRRLGDTSCNTCV